MNKIHAHVGKRKQWLAIEDANGTMRFALPPDARPSTAPDAVNAALRHILALFERNPDSWLIETFGPRIVARKRIERDYLAQVYRSIPFYTFVISGETMA